MRPLSLPVVTTSNQIFVKDLKVAASIGKNYWNVLNAAPLNYRLSVVLDLNSSILQRSGSTDDLNHSISYADISNYILEYLNAGNAGTERLTFEDSNLFLNAIFARLMDHNGKIPNLNDKYCSKLNLVLDNDRCHLKLKNLRISKQFSLHDNISRQSNFIVFEGLQLLTKIGIFDFERLRKQYVSINLKLDLDEMLQKCYRNGQSGNFNEYISNSLLEELVKYVEETEFLTIEALITSVNDYLRERFGIVNVAYLKISKLNAVLNAEEVGLLIINNKLSDTSAQVQIKQTVHNNDEFLQLNKGNSATTTKKPHIAYLAFGTNHGDTMANIYLMIESLRASLEIKILATSSLYETAPMYYFEQSNFVNGALKIQTSLAPIELLRFLKKVEYDKLHRVKEFDNGPRTIDLDIILYDDIIYNNTTDEHAQHGEEPLIVPHQRMLERLFVLNPLSEILEPYEDVHPVTNRSIINHHYRELLAVSKKELTQTVVPLKRRTAGDADGSSRSYYDILRFNFKNDKTLIMGIVNMTKNSFSDGGRNFELDNAFESVTRLIEQGADIIDIGATSTKPGVDIHAAAADHETRLIVPLVRKIRSSQDPKINGILISVDTFFSKTARETVLSGADIVNDISMGLYDEDIYNVVRELQVPYIMNHTRGTPDNMVKLTTYDVNQDRDVVEFTRGVNVSALTNELEEDLEEINFINAVSKELAVSVHRAMKAGVNKWQIILDPGIGFAKTLPQNLMIVRQASRFRDYSVLFKNSHQTKTFNEANGLYVGEASAPEGNQTTANKKDPQEYDLSYLSFAKLPILLGPSRKKFISRITKEELSDKNSSKKIVIGTSGVIMACIANKTNIVRVHDVDEIKKICLLGDAIYNNII